jgi:hypothetical protein
VEVRPKDAERGQLRDKFERKALGGEVTFDVRENFPLHEGAHGVTRQLLLGTQQFIELIEVEVFQDAGHKISSDKTGRQ